MADFNNNPFAQKYRKTLETREFSRNAKSVGSKVEKELRRDRSSKSRALMAKKLEKRD